MLILGIDFEGSVMLFSLMGILPALFSLLVLGQGIGEYEKFLTEHKARTVLINHQFWWVMAFLVIFLLNIAVYIALVPKMVLISAALTHL